MEQHKARAAQIRARAQWVEKGEQNTIFVFSVSKKVELMPRLWIALKLIMGKLLQNRVTYLTLKRIKNKNANLYKKKMSGEKTDEKLNRFKSNMSVPRLSEEQMQSCEVCLSVCLSLPSSLPPPSLPLPPSPRRLSHSVPRSPNLPTPLSLTLRQVFCEQIRL